MCKLILGLVCLFLSLGYVSLVWADAVTDWNTNAGKAAIAACLAPVPLGVLQESRMYAMMHIAVHDALNAINRRSKPYVLDLQGPSTPSIEATVAAAARDVLVPLLGEIPREAFPQECIDAGVASVEADYAAALSAIPDGAPKTQGIAVGHAAAAIILAPRIADGSDTPLLDFDYPQGTNPGEYRFTPGTPFAGGVEWGNVTPFVLKDSTQFRPGPPYEVTSKKYTADFNEVKMLGVRIGSTRTAEQTQIAHFWVESSPLQWNRIARAISAAERLDVWENARLFGLLNLALADGYIGVSEAKYHYNYWRPVTAIQLAEMDGNPDTIADPGWVPLEPTPAVPEYDSGHSVEGGAAAQVLKRFFKTDQVSFTTCSLTLPLIEEQCGGANEVLRSYSSFSQAADENGVSRIYVGFHFRKAVDEGIKHGRKIGDRAVDHFLQPVH
jgi:hypothetical protein